MKGGLHRLRKDPEFFPRPFSRLRDGRFGLTPEVLQARFDLWRCLHAPQRHLALVDHVSNAKTAESSCPPMIVVIESRRLLRVSGIKLSRNEYAAVIPDVIGCSPARRTRSIFHA